MAHAQKPDFVFRRNGRARLNRQGRQFSRLLAAKVFASVVVMLDTPCCEVVWRVLSTHSIRQFPLHFPSHASPCSITFQLDSTTSQVSCLNNSTSCSHIVFIYILRKTEKMAIIFLYNNPLAPDFFWILAHPVYKMWKTQEPKKVALWNKRHFEEKKTESVQHV